MERGKNIVVTALLIAVIIAAVGFTVWYLAGRKPGVPEFVTGERIELVDKDTLEVVTKTRGEWEKLGSKEGRCKNPNTGVYSMVFAVACNSCGAKVPSPFAMGFKPGEEGNYVCPKCGKRVVGR